MGPPMIFKVLQVILRFQWGQWGCLGVQGGQRCGMGAVGRGGRVGDPVVPSGWFDGSSVES